MKKTYLIALIITVIALLIVNIFFLVNNKTCSCNQHEKNTKQEKDTKNINCNCYVTETLSLDKEQASKYAKIKQKHQAIALDAIDSLHISQEILMDYLASNSDSLKISELENRITEFQKILLHQHVEQYQELKAILKSKQIAPMNKLFNDLFVCKPSCKHKHDGCVTQPE